jgi:hypothetical protein
MGTSAEDPLPTMTRLWAGIGVVSPPPSQSAVSIGRASRCARIFCVSSSLCGCITRSTLAAFHESCR